MVLKQSLVLILAYSLRRRPSTASVPGSSSKKCSSYEEVMMRSPVRIVLALVLLSFAQNRNAQEELVPNNPDVERPYTPPVIFEKTLRSDSGDPAVTHQNQNAETPIPTASQPEKSDQVPQVQVPFKTEVPENLDIPLETAGDLPSKPVPLAESYVVNPSQGQGPGQIEPQHENQVNIDVAESGNPLLPQFLVPPTDGSAPDTIVEDVNQAASEAQGQDRGHDAPEPEPQEEIRDAKTGEGEETQQQQSSEEDEGLPLSEEDAKPPAAETGTESDNSSTESINKSEDSIPSFSEWTQLQLSQRKESIINNIKNKTSLQEGKNFASPDCGAKVINSNPEAQNPSGIISSSHDEYMLNRCTVNTWFILELCEPLKIEQVSIGNLELFSSNPHEFELGVSDRYPTRDWTILGPYFAADARSMHSFPLPTNNSTFGKFLRVSVKSHHGNEHYCPLSVLKVYGKSEYEVLESETTHAEDEESNSNSVFEEEVNDDKPVRKSVLGTATDAVMDMVKKAASALVNNEILKSDGEASKESSESGNKTTNSSRCLTLNQCIRDSEYKDVISSTLSCNTSLVIWLSSVAPWCGWEYCHSLLNKSSIGSPWMPEGLFVAVYGPSIIEALCNFNKPIQSCDVNTDNKSLVQLTSGEPNDTSVAATQSGPPGLAPVPPPTPVNPTDLSTDPPVSSATPPALSPPTTPQQPQVVLHPEPVTFEEPAQKESVFVRLSNRIKNLERNQSLSSGYLEELSRRFKKQNEDLNTVHESFRRTLNESMTKCKRVEDNLRYEVRKLNRNIDNLRELIWRVELQRGGLVLFSVLQFIFTVFCWWTRDRKGQTQAQAPPILAQGPGQNSEHLLTPRKRNNSETLKSVKKKKKRKDALALALAHSKAQGDPGPGHDHGRSSFQVTPNHVPKVDVDGQVSTPPFEFKSPAIVHNPTSSSQQQPQSTMTQFHGSSGVLKPGVSLSSVSDLSVSEDSVTSGTPTTPGKASHKKKSKFKSFFLGAK